MSAQIEIDVLIVGSGPAGGDAYVGWRRHVVADNCTAELAQVMKRILGLV